MEVVYEQKFLKDVGNINDGKSLKRVKAKLEEVEPIVHHTHEDNGEVPKIPGYEQVTRARPLLPYPSRGLLTGDYYRDHAG